MIKDVSFLICCNNCKNILITSCGIDIDSPDKLNKSIGITAYVPLITNGWKINMETQLEHYCPECKDKMGENAEN